MKVVRIIPALLVVGGLAFVDATPVLAQSEKPATAQKQERREEKRDRRERRDDPRVRDDRRPERPERPRLLDLSPTDPVPAILRHATEPG